jgi:hypothetical protein
VSDRDEPTALEAVESRRAARKAELAEKRDAQRILDLEAIDALEIEHGDSNVAVLDVPYTPGLPTCVAARCPKPEEIKRYRSRLKAKKGEQVDAVEAAEELASICRVYPSDSEVYARMLSARPGIHVQLGVAAVGLAAGSEEARGKG